MTDGEKEILFLLNDVYDRFSELPEQHSADMGEFVNALHILQHLVMIRSVRRKYPDIFPVKLKVDVSVDGDGDIDKAIGMAVSQKLDGVMKDFAKR